MLKTRVITAIVMAVVALGAIFLAPPIAFALLAGGVVLGVGGWEATRLAQWTDRRLIAVYLIALIAISNGLWWGVPMPISGMALGLAAVIWVLAIGWLAHPEKRLNPNVIAVFLALMLTGTWISLVLLQSVNPWLIVWVVLIVAAADVGAYFTGKAFGKAKLAPHISPGKTQAGAVGGLISAMAMAPLAQQLLPVYQQPSVWLVGGLGLLLAGISIVGDLTISLLKRQAGLKDSSNLLPGHGGILDRLDSLGAALPFFTLAMAWFHHA